jgi:hypothetical protein
VLISGDHGKIDKWRREQSLLRTRQKRPDLLETAPLTKQDRKILDRLDREDERARAFEHALRESTKESTKDTKENENPD